MEAFAGGLAGLLAELDEHELGGVHVVHNHRVLRLALLTVERLDGGRVHRAFRDDVQLHVGDEEILALFQIARADDDQINAGELLGVVGKAVVQRDHRVAVLQRVRHDRLAVQRRGRLRLDLGERVAGRRGRALGGDLRVVDRDLQRIAVLHVKAIFAQRADRNHRLARAGVGRHRLAAQPRGLARRNGRFRRRHGSRAEQRRRGGQSPKHLLHKQVLPFIPRVVPHVVSPGPFSIVSPPRFASHYGRSILFCQILFFIRHDKKVLFDNFRLFVISPSFCRHFML